MGWKLVSLCYNLHMTEQELAEQIKKYQELASQNKNVDLAGLALNALNQHETNLLSRKEKRWAYLISFALPPFGLLFAAKFYMSDKRDGKQGAYVCIALTAASLVLSALIIKLLFAGSGTNLQQIQQIKLQNIQQLYQ